MISVYNIKPKFQQLLKPLLGALYKGGVTANHLTIAAIALSAGLGICLWYVQVMPAALLIVPAGLLLRMALNALDGMMARTYSMQSKLGEVLNELGDVVSDLFIYLPFIKITGAGLYPVFAFVLLGIINEFAGVMGKVLGGERRYEGPMGKSDRALLAGALCLACWFWPGMSAHIDKVFYLAIVLLIISTFTRIKRSIVS